jgi:hypothetical protein
MTRLDGLSIAGWLVLLDGLDLDLFLVSGNFLLFGFFVFGDPERCKQFRLVHTKQDREHGVHLLYCLDSLLLECVFRCNLSLGSVIFSVFGNSRRDLCAVLPTSG